MNSSFLKLWIVLCACQTLALDVNGNAVTSANGHGQQHARMRQDRQDTAVPFSPPAPSTSSSSSSITTFANVLKRIAAPLLARANAVSTTSFARTNVKTIVHFSDVHLNISASLDPEATAAFRFQYGHDAPLRLLEASLEYAKQILPNPDFFLYTGDHAAHGDFTDQYIAEAVTLNVKTMEKYFPPSEKQETTAIIGNADGNPDYHMEVTNPATQVNPSIALISNVWQQSLSPSNLDAFNRRGYLSFPLDERLEVLTLNTVPYSPKHLPDTSGVEDPFQQFQWLNETLATLQAASKFAYITGHIAPFVDSYGGDPQWHPHYIRTYKSIVSQYADVIKAQFYGHVHSIEFRLPTADSSLELMPLFTTGSISPLFTNNPSFTVWEYDATTYDVVDYVVYGTNLSESDQTLNWRPLFRASETYGLSSLSVASLQDFADRMASDAGLLEDYYWNMKAQSHRTPPCTSTTCRAKILCTTQWFTTKEEYLNCVQAQETSLQSTTSTPNRRQLTHYDAGALAPHDVYRVIGWTVAGAGFLMACVLIVTRALKHSGVLKTNEQREQEFENVFPML